MLVRHLSYFVALAREGHFARAAATCNIAQPTLTAAIQKLEDDLEVRLVVRGRRYVGLTPEGEKLLAWGREMLVGYDSLRGDLAGRHHALSGTLRLGVVPAAVPVLGLITDRFTTTHPGVMLDIRSLPEGGGAEAQGIDAAISYLDEGRSPGALPLYRERLVFVTRRDRPEALHDRITWRAASQARLCLLGGDRRGRRQIDDLAAAAGVAIKPGILADSFMGVCAHLRHGDWASIVPHTYFCVFGGVPDLAMVELVEPEHSRPVGLALPGAGGGDAGLGASLRRSLEGVDVGAALADLLAGRPRGPADA